MSSNIISVSTFDRVDIQEDQKNEFKASIFISPETHTPGAKQMHVIAETLAAFMNAEGGMLYIGVNDNGQISGMEKDLSILATQPSTVAARSVRHDDTTFTYGETADKYELKIRSIVRAFLSPNANALVGQIVTKPVNGKSVCRVVCKPCAPDEFVYSYRKYAPNKPEVAEIFQRIGNQKKNLQGVERDEFVRKRVMAGFDKQLSAIRATVTAAGDGKSQGDSALAMSVRELLAYLDSQKLDGVMVSVSGGQPFTEKSVTAAKKAKALAWEGQHYAEVSGWQELVLKVLEKLQEIDAAKFDELAAQAEYKKHLVVIRKPKEKHPECYPVKFGTGGKVRVKKSLGNKMYLWREDMALRKMIAAFGVDVSKFMFVAG